MLSMSSSISFRLRCARYFSPLLLASAIRGILRLLVDSRTRVVMATLTMLLFVMSYLLLSIGIAAAHGAASDTGLSCKTASLKDCPRPLAARNDRVDILDGSRHYHGGFNVRSESYTSSVVYAATHVLAPLTLASIGLSLFCMILCLYPGFRACLAHEIPYRQRKFIVLSSLSLLLCVISLASMVSFIVGNHKLYSTARSDVRNLVTSSTFQANKEIHGVAKDLNASVYFLTMLDHKVSNTTATTSNSTRQLVAMILGAQMRLVGRQSWNDQTPRLHQYSVKHIFLVKWDIFWSQFSVLISFILLIMGFAMVVGRLYNPRWTWTRSWPYQLHYMVPTGFLVAAMLLCAAVHTFALTKMFGDGVDALEEYGPPFNTTFDYKGFLPCAELSTIGEQAMSDVQEALAFIDRNSSAIRVGMLRDSTSGLVRSAFSSQLDLMLVNASSSLAATVPKIESLRRCSEIRRFVHELARKDGPRLNKAGNIAWISLVVAASTFVFLPVLWGTTRAMMRPDLDLPPLAPRLPTPPSVNIPAQPQLVFPQPEVHFGPEDCPRVRQVDIWTDFFWNKDMKTPVPEDN